MLVAVPVKRFYVAKRRLAPVLDAEARSRLGRHLARHTLGVIQKAGVEPLVLAADEEVAEWAQGLGWTARLDQGGSLDEAAAAAVAVALQAGDPWMIIHADLPLLASLDVRAACEVLERGGSVIGPSNDGGTSLIGGRDAIRFSYGAASFHRHLARLSQPTVLIRMGVALDLDDPSDLEAALVHPAGAWLRRYAPGR